jgi:hypothetical protein
MLASFVMMEFTSSVRPVLAMLSPGRDLGAMVGKVMGGSCLAILKGCCTRQVVDLSVCRSVGRSISQSSVTRDEDNKLPGRPAR